MNLLNSALIETNYERVVSVEVRVHTEELMREWRSRGRDDDEIEHIVKSAVLNAFAQGRYAGLQEVADFVNLRTLQR